MMTSSNGDLRRHRAHYDVTEMFKTVNRACIFSYYDQFLAKAKRLPSVDRENICQFCFYFDGQIGIHIEKFKTTPKEEENTSLLDTRTYRVTKQEGMSTQG